MNISGSEKIYDIFKEGIFVIHVVKGHERHDERIKELFLRNGWHFEFVTDGDPLLFRDEFMKKY